MAAADDSLEYIFFIFQRKYLIFDIHMKHQGYYLFARWRIHMKHQALFSSKYKNKSVTYCTFAGLFNNNKKIRGKESALPFLLEISVNFNYSDTLSSFISSR